MKVNKPHQRSIPFKQTREQHLLEAAEDYTELIYELIEETGEARTCEIAKRLGISHVTALRTIQRLQREGFVTTQPRKPIELTALGKKTAKNAQEKHSILLNFLLQLGVPLEVAQKDVEGIEHHISKTTLETIKSHLKKAQGQ